jgi:hypothetical protein
VDWLWLEKKIFKLEKDCKTQKGWWMGNQKYFYLWTSIGGEKVYGDALCYLAFGMR